MIKKSKKKTSGFQENIFLSVLFRLFIVLALFFLSRIIFYLFNYQYYASLDTPEILRIFLIGIRFDISAVLIINAPFIVFNTIPFPFRTNKIYQRILNVYFYLINSLALLTNFGDMIYFRFTLKRTTADIFNYLGVGGDFDKLIPQFAKDFWYVLVIWVIFVLLLIWLSSRLKLVSAGKKPGKKGDMTFYFVNSLLFLITIFVTVIGIRGGFQLRPIGIITAGNYTSAKNVPLLINTPFAIAKTFGNESLTPVTYFDSEKELEKIYSPVHQGDTAGFRQMNVMIIIMESFSAEHLGVLNRSVDNGRYQGFTPFLDSLTGKGYVIKAFANGKTSIQGIPAVLSGIPSLMNESYIQSNYSTDKVISIAGALKPKGYTTAFFHGGTNGTMGFDAYTRFTGFDHYYGRSEYNNDRDYDGKWGIRDEEFLQYTAGVINKMPQPFVSALFSLSSHHPYVVPPKYTHKFRKGKLPIQEAVMYSDFSLKRFFETAKKMDWFKNTLFVITADHTSEASLPWYQTDAGQYSIPIIFYQPGNKLKGRTGIVAQQTDIVPSIFDLIHYDRDYLAFGSSVFDSVSPRFSVHYISGSYGMVKDGYLIQFDGTKTTALFDLKKDSLQSNNLVLSKLPVRLALENFLKAYIQQYNNRVIENRLTAE